MKKYKCVKCKSKIDPELSICPVCQEFQPAEERGEYIRKKYGMSNIKIENIACEKCGCDQVFIMKDYDFEFTICTSCGKSYMYKTQTSQAYENNIKPVITCPYCQSTNTKKISTASKVGSVAMWGIFALGKTTKQWHCNNCKSDF